MYQHKNSTIPKPQRTPNASTSQIPAKSNNPWRIYCDLNMSNLRTVHFGFAIICVIPLLHY